MNSKIKIIVVGSLAIITALLLSACGVVAAPSAGLRTGGPGGMMGGGYGFRGVALRCRAMATGRA